MTSAWIIAPLLCACSCLIPSAVHAGPAINQFETKDLESTPGDLQFQSQNAVSFGQPHRKIGQTAAGDLAFDDNSVTRERYALEMQMSIATWFRTRVGVEYEKERLNDPASAAQANAFADLHLTGVALEGVFVLIPPKKEGLSLGILTEYDKSVRERTGQLFIGPIVQMNTGPWSALANLLLVQHFNTFDRKRDFAYAAQVQYEISPTWALAVEGYGTIDRLGNSGTRPADSAQFGDFDQHRLGPIVYYRFNPNGGITSGAAEKKTQVKGLRKDDDDDKPGAKLAADKDDDDKGPSVSIGLGVLFGLNGKTPSETLKLSLEYNF